MCVYRLQMAAAPEMTFLLSSSDGTIRSGGWRPSCQVGHASLGHLRLPKPAAHSWDALRQPIITNIKGQISDYMHVQPFQVRLESFQTSSSSANVYVVYKQPFPSWPSVGTGH